MSLRWRIMGSTVLVIVLTVLASIGVGYYATQSRLGEFVDRIGNDEASRLARSLSREYTAAGGWETADPRPCPTRLGTHTIGRRCAQGREQSEESHGRRALSSTSRTIASPHQDRVRVVIAGVDGRVWTSSSQLRSFTWITCPNWPPGGSRRSRLTSPLCPPTSTGAGRCAASRRSST